MKGLIRMNGKPEPKPFGTQPLLFSMHSVDDRGRPLPVISVLELRPAVLQRESVTLLGSGSVFSALGSGSKAKARFLAFASSSHERIQTMRIYGNSTPHVLAPLHKRNAIPVGGHSWAVPTCVTVRPSQPASGPRRSNATPQVKKTDVATCA